MLWWFSFAGDDRLLGVVIAEGDTWEIALKQIHATRCNPGGQVAFHLIEPESIPESLLVAILTLPRFKLLQPSDITPQGIELTTIGELQAPAAPSNG